MIPGILAAAMVAAVAVICSHVVPLVGAPVFAIVLGVALRTLGPLPAACKPGVSFSARLVLQAAIVVSGFALSLVTVLRTGLGTLPVTLGTIAVALILAPILGRLLRLDAALRTLVGVGTAICGASAIAAVASVIEPEEADVALSIATVFFYNIVAVLVFPPIGHALGLAQQAFGLWAGTAINDTSSVVAAGYVYGRDAGDYATIVKLTRATLILPIVAAIALWRARTRARGHPRAVEADRAVVHPLVSRRGAGEQQRRRPAVVARPHRDGGRIHDQRRAGSDRPANRARAPAARRDPTARARLSALDRGRVVVARHPARHRLVGAPGA